MAQILCVRCKAGKSKNIHHYGVSFFLLLNSGLKNLGIFFCSYAERSTTLTFLLRLVGQLQQHLTSDAINPSSASASSLMWHLLLPACILSTRRNELIRFIEPLNDLDIAQSLCKTDKSKKAMYERLILTST